MSIIQLIHTKKRPLLHKILVFSIVNLELWWVSLARAQAQTRGLKNPLGEGATFSTIIAKIAELATLIGLPIAALFIIYSGFLYVTARGDTTKVKKAHDTFLWSVIGTAIILGAYVIATAINQFAQSLG